MIPLKKLETYLKKLENMATRLYLLKALAIANNDLKAVIEINENLYKLESEILKMRLEKLVQKG